MLYTVIIFLSAYQKLKKYMSYEKGKLIFKLKIVQTKWYPPTTKFFLIYI